jgi:hypothetical protein
MPTFMAHPPNRTFFQEAMAQIAILLLNIEIYRNISEHGNDQPIIPSLLPRRSLLTSGRGTRLRVTLLEPIFFNVEG